jgi:hypothetical protein
MPNDPTTSPLWPADSPAVTAHITLLQGIINRLANNSSSCKTWCLTLTAAFLSLAGATHQPRIVTFALVPVVVFGFLDAMYLAHERSYRELYARIVQKISNGSYTRADAFEAQASVTFPRIFLAFWSWSVITIYGGLVLAYIVASCAGWIALIKMP